MNNEFTMRDFVYWLQGLFEVGNPKSLDETQTQIIKDHLKLVLNKVTPDHSKGCQVTYPQIYTIGMPINPLDYTTTCSCEPNPVNPYGDRELVSYSAQGSC